MGKSTGISWTDHTWNPWRGCHKVSQGCKNCYMFREQKRYGNDPNTVICAKPGTFNAPLTWKEPAMVFTCSWSDFFIEEADKWRDEAWNIIRQTPWLTYQILTKRPENIAARLPYDWGFGWDHVWLGITAEDQPMANRRIPILLAVPATTRFISAEPLLGEIGFRKGIYMIAENGWRGTSLWGIDWVIVGGESGPGYRPMDLAWARDIVAQCKAANVPVFVKQLGGWPNKRDDPAEWPEDLRVQEFPAAIPGRAEEEM